MSGAGAARQAGRLVRLAEGARPALAFTLDGEPAQGLQGDTVLTAMLMAGARLRHAEFGGEARAGFCLMGLCQDCWVWQAQGPRLRACQSELREGMALLTAPPADWPAIQSGAGA